MANKKQNEWKLVGKITRNDMRGADPITKLHQKLLKLAPGGKSVSDFGMSKEAMEYFRAQLVALGKKKGFTGNALANAVGMAMLEFSPAQVEGITGFQVYYRGK